MGPATYFEQNGHIRRVELGLSVNLPAPTLIPESMERVTAEAVHPRAEWQETEQWQAAHGYYVRARKHAQRLNSQNEHQMGR